MNRNGFIGNFLFSHADLSNMILEKSFYTHHDVVSVSKRLLGKYLFTSFNGRFTGGIITETEAYAGLEDKASHAFDNRRTRRTAIMFNEGGVAYVYLCYGIHSLFNIVTNRKGIPHAVLIRGIQPVYGKEIMLERAGKNRINNHFSNGPGKVAKIMGIHYSHSGLPIAMNCEDDHALEIWVEDRDIGITNEDITATARIGVDYAGEDAQLPYRFIIPWQ